MTHSNASDFPTGADDHLIPVRRETIETVAEDFDIGVDVLQDALASHQADITSDGVFGFIDYLETNDYGRVTSFTDDALYLQVVDDPVWRRERDWHDWSDVVFDAVKDAYSLEVEQQSDLVVDAWSGYVVSSLIPVTSITNLQYDVSWRDVGELAEFLAYEVGIVEEHSVRYALVQILQETCGMTEAMAMRVAADALATDELSISESVREVNAYHDGLKQSLEGLGDASIYGGGRRVGDSVFEIVAGL